MSASPLPTSGPAAQGVDATGVHAFLDALEAAPEIEPHSLMIVRHGHLVASGWWAPYTPERLHLLYSLSKSFTGTAAALAEAEGLLDFDAPVISYFPEFEDGITDPRSRAMLVRHVASMASGHLRDTVDEAFGRDPAEPVRGFLRLPPDADPGTVFAYNQPATYTLAAIVQRVTGQSLSDYLRPRLLDPLGIGEVAWRRDRAGRELGFSGLHATTDAVARLGRLYLCDGLWEGRRLLPQGWVARASQPRIPTAGAMGDADRQDWDRGYGYQFWTSRHGYRGDGAYGQFCLVLPEHDVVIAATAATERMQEYLNLVWEHLLPAFGPEPLTRREAADARLRERLGRLALPPAPGRPAPPERERDWTAAAFRASAGTGPVRSAALDRDADGWTLTLTGEGDRPDHPDRLALRLGEESWTVAEEPVPTAVSGGWTDAGTLAVDVVFLETPHRLALTCSLVGGTLTASWRTRPLHGGRLTSLCAPRRSV
ncbi:serine hydrolase domain-containing protein [Streptomyces sp. SID5643]|uniref:serine hydrolase domain-containing protein n=1 Tax=Streptomyces sp. SID5643 TaxID=2690307 RepID=UPI00136BC031|nr:serine hydrolase domain-containing protein [Streptomyces sp. SID5643]MZF86109.1 serine hydrolase [Streptomyces sp. SID5643]